MLDLFSELGKLFYKTFYLFDLRGETLNSVYTFEYVYMNLCLRLKIEIKTNKILH